MGSYDGEQDILDPNPEILVDGEEDEEDEGNDEEVSALIELAEINQRIENEALRNETIMLEATLAKRKKVLKRRGRRGIETRGSSVLSDGGPRGSRGASPVVGGGDAEG